MRLIVACPACNRQYDATGRDVGSRFRCHCGAVVTVKEPRGHNASVVKCSNCGGPRHGDEPNCRYCGASFTIHEQDLHTICPNCLARISDKAKFCHHCATPIVGKQMAGAVTEMSCPVCGEDVKLYHRQLAPHIQLHECRICAGMWIATEAFEFLTRSVSAGAMPPSLQLPGGQQASQSAGSGTTQQQGPLYRPCPVCNAFMNRKNFGNTSGVIIDLCKDHGIWFDADELTNILHWIHRGGLERSKQLQAEEEAKRAKKERERRAERQAGVYGDPRQGDAVFGSSRGGGDLLGGGRNEMEGGNLIEAIGSIINFIRKH